ncbi:hypothetical protein BH20ACT2_BH20ACT2_18810 [soil metagenome]
MADGGSGGLSGWIGDLVDRLGEVGVGALIAIENIFPPIPSEAILPFAGYRAEVGELNLVGVWVAATVGSLVGALVLYGIGAIFGYDRLYALAAKRWFVVLGQKDLERGDRFFERHGVKVVLFGRCVPLVRSVVSVPAGLSRMPLGQFCLYTALGSAVWNAVFIGIGFQLGQRWERVEGYVRPVALLVLVAVLVGIAVLAVRKVRRRSLSRAGTAT